MVTHLPVPYLLLAQMEIILQSLEFHPRAEVLPNLPAHLPPESP
jgi:hypothetical protein